MATCLKNAFQILQRLSMRSTRGQIHCRYFHSQRFPLNFHVSLSLYAEPLKKKKKIDPAQIIAKEQKRKKKIEKQIKRLEKSARQLKPVTEIIIDSTLRKEASIRQREKLVITSEETERRALLMKDWTRYCLRNHFQDMAVIRVYLRAQQRALSQLREESEELYQQAIQIDDQLIPFEFYGPVETPPIDDYEAVDGDYIDTSKKWE